MKSKHSSYCVLFCCKWKQQFSVICMWHLLPVRTFDIYALTSSYRPRDTMNFNCCLVQDIWYQAALHQYLEQKITTLESIKLFHFYKSQHFIQFFLLRLMLIFFIIPMGCKITWYYTWYARCNLSNMHDRSWNKTNFRMTPDWGDIKPNEHRSLEPHETGIKVHHKGLADCNGVFESFSPPQGRSAVHGLVWTLTPLATARFHITLGRSEVTGLAKPSEAQLIPSYILPPSVS